MSLAKAKIEALKQRCERINQINANLEFTEKELEQRKKQFNQDYLVLPPLSPNARYLRPQTQSPARELPQRSKSKNVYTLNTDFYRSTIYPATNTGAINNFQNNQNNTNIVQNPEPMVIQQPEKKHSKQPKQTTNMVNEDKLQPTSKSIFKLVPVQHTNQNQQNVKLVVKPRQTVPVSNSNQNNSTTTASNLFATTTPTSNLFTQPVSSETKNLFGTKKAQIPVAEVPKEVEPSKPEEKPQITSFFGSKPSLFQKTNVFGKTPEPVNTNQTPTTGFNFTDTFQNNTLQKTKTAPVFPSSQQNTNSLFNQNNMKDNKASNQISSSALFGNIIANKQQKTGLFGSGLAGNTPFVLNKPGNLFDKNVSLIKSAPLSLFGSIGENKPQSLFGNNPEAAKIIQKQDENKGRDTPVFEVEDKKNQQLSEQSNPSNAQNNQSGNQPEQKDDEVEPKEQTKQNQQKKEEVKYPHIDSPILQLKNPQEIQVPKQKEQNKKEIEQKESKGPQMLGPKGKTFQVLPFFGNSGKSSLFSGEPNPLNPTNKPAVTNNPPSGNNASSLFTGFGSNSQTNAPTTNLFTASANTSSLFGNPLAKASGTEFSQAFLNKAATGGGIFSVQNNSLFNQGSQSSGGSLFSGQNTLFGGPNTGSMFGGPAKPVSQPENKEDEEQSGEGDDQPLQAEENFNPELSTGRYDYIQTSIRFKEPISKFRKGKGQLLENVTVSLQQFKDNPSVFLFVRLANKVIGFTGHIIQNATQIRILNNSSKNIEISKILESGDNVQKPELCLLRLQFKDEQSGQRFKQQFQKVLKPPST